MKRIKLVLALFSLNFFAACIDIEELINLKADNSGSYSMNLDMSKLIEFANSMRQGKESKKPKEKVDTLIYFKNAKDEFAKLSTEEKRIFQEGYLKVNLDEAAGKMKMQMFTPFTNLADLMLVKKELPGMMKKLNLMDKAGDKNKGGTDLSKLDEEDKDLGDINPSGKHFSFNASQGKISYTINDKDKLKELASNDSMMQMMQQMSMMMGDMTTTTIITLPSPAKNVSNPKAELSADKKTITIKSIITELMEKPEQGEYSIEY